MNKLPNLDDIDGIVVDIEGTTTPITFVYDVLFPFAREHALGWLQREGGTESGQELIAELCKVAAEDGAPISETDPVEGVAAFVHELMDADRKVTALKALQGEIWKSGYASGELEGTVWPDVVEALRRWRNAGLSIWVYSSGSIAAQKLLFGNSDQGDLLEWFDGYFDTTSGNKKVAGSYQTIAETIGRPPQRLLFATDNLEEADAASDAGWHVVLMRRPGNPEVPDHPYVEASTFDEFP